MSRTATVWPSAFERVRIARERRALLELDRPLLGEEVRRRDGLLHVECQSSTPTTVCATKPMMRVPPGEPTTSRRRPRSSSTIVGAMLLSGRLPPSIRFATGLPPTFGLRTRSP